MVVAPTADLVVLDPVVTFNRQTRNYACLVFDTLYGLDTSWQAQPQMVEGHEVEDDGLTWLLFSFDWGAPTPLPSSTARMSEG